ncbi:hypothetical protein GCM10025794_32730 [Massilia kyonggiensis]
MIGYLECFCTRILTVGVPLSGRGVVNNMEKASEPSQTQPAPEEPVKSIEDDGKGDSSSTGGVTDEQWRSMMDVVLAIYEFREEE